MPTHLYLDFDGVLHPASVYLIDGRPFAEAGTLFEKAAGLATFLVPFDVAVVLSTTWVAELGLRYTKSRLPPNLAARVIGATYEPPHTPNWRAQSRFQQIRTDATRRGIGRRWLAIDDNVIGWPETMREHLVATSPAVGLQQRDLERLAALLAKAGGG